VLRFAPRRDDAAAGDGAGRLVARGEKRGHRGAAGLRGLYANELSTGVGVERVGVATAPQVTAMPAPTVITAPAAIDLNITVSRKGSAAFA
jgi:hypothetical protein